MTHINLILALLAYRATADMSEMSEALRAHLSEAGLPTDGNRKVLEARWKAHSKRKAEAIIHRIITLPDAVTSTEDIATLCANTLRAEINTATLYSEDGKMRWANGRALTTLETMDSLREDVEKFKDEIQTQNDKIEDQTQQIEGLQDKIKIQDDKIEDQNHKMEGLQNTIKNQNDKIDDLQDIIKTQNVKIEDLEDVIKNQNDIIKKQNDRIEGLENMIKTQNDKIEGLIQDIKDLKATNGQQALKIGRLDSICKALLKSRCRFFAMYKRDKKPRLMTPQDYTQIEEGNEAVHFGDPLLDAFMFEEKVREDILIYIDLYGLAFTQVLSIQNDKRTLEVLQDHATVKVVKDFPACEDFYELFAMFVNAFTMAGLRSDYMDDESGTVAQAYKAFQAENKVVQERRRAFIKEQRRKMYEASSGLRGGSD